MIIFQLLAAAIARNTLHFRPATDGRDGKMSESFITRICYSPKSHGEILRQVESHGVQVLCRDKSQCELSKKCGMVLVDSDEAKERRFRDCRRVQVMVQVWS
jgi:hypothetical protein